MTKLDGGMTRLRPRPVAAAIVIGTAVLFIFGLQPIILGGAVEKGLLDERGVGTLAMIEMMLLALGNIVGQTVMNGRMRIKVAVAAAALTAIDLACVLARSGTDLIALRSVAGLLEGLLMGCVAMISAHSDRPDRTNGLLMSLSGIPQVLAVYLIPLHVVPSRQMDASLAVLAAFALCAAVTGVLVTNRVERHVSAPAGKAVWTLPLALLALSIFIQNAGIGATWAYSERLGSERNLGGGTIGLAISIGIAAQMVGAFAAGMGGIRFHPAKALILGCCVQVATVLVLIATRSGTAYLISLVVFSLFWPSMGPFQVRAIIQADPTRKTAMLMGPIGLVGIGLGPWFASLGITDNHVVGAFVTAAGLLTGSLVLHAISVPLIYRRLNAPTNETRPAEDIRVAPVVVPTHG